MPVYSHRLVSDTDQRPLRRFNGLCRLPAGGRMRRIDILGVPWYAQRKYPENTQLT